MKNPVITITMEDGGVIKAELYPDKAPNTVRNFLDLAKAVRQGHLFDARQDVAYRRKSCY